jgi:Ca2+-binding RTX toxin-like protein
MAATVTTQSTPAMATTTSGGKGNDVLTGAAATTSSTAATQRQVRVRPQLRQDVISDFNRGDHIEFDGGCCELPGRTGSDASDQPGHRPRHMLQRVTAGSLHASDFLFS